MIISVLRLLPISDQREAVLRILRSMTAQTMAKPGCVCCGVYEGYGFNPRVLYLEEWTSEEEMHRHIQSELYLRVLTAMDLSKDEPQISFHHVSSTEHIELIETLRTDNASAI